MNAIDSTAHDFASTKLYHPKGAVITFSWYMPVFEGRISKMIAEDMFANVEILIEAGFSVNAPGLEAGEEREAVGAISRREKSDGTPILDLFAPSEALVYKLITIYLDTPEQIAAFETATGLTIKDIPLNEGDQAINRESKTAARLLVNVKRQATAILKPNPKFDPNEQETAKKKPARLFVGWERVELKLVKPEQEEAGNAPKAPAASPTTPPTGIGSTSAALPNQGWISPAVWVKTRAEWEAFIEAALKAFAMDGSAVDDALRRPSTCEGLPDWRKDKLMARAAVIAAAKKYDLDAIDAYTSTLPGDSGQNFKLNEMARKIVAACKPTADEEFDAIPRMNGGGADPMGREAIAAELKNEWVTITRVEKDATKRAHDMWQAYAPMEDSSEPLRIVLFREDLRKVKAAGYTIDWPSAPGSVLEGIEIPVTTKRDRANGWRIDAVIEPTLPMDASA